MKNEKKWENGWKNEKREEMVKKGKMVKKLEKKKRKNGKICQKGKMVKNKREKWLRNWKIKEKW